jgi:L-amino acid N-acyltransferase YncA
MAAAIRVATEDDAAAVQAIYAPYVRDTAISFETDPPTVDEMRRRIAAVLEWAPWLVCERDGAVAGYAYAGRFHARAAYQWTVEVTVYVDRGRHRAGVGRALYEALLGALRLQGFRTAVGIIALPNPASVGLHERLGFRCDGMLPRLGYKHGRWHDVGWWRLELQAPGEPPAPPRPLPSVVDTPAWTERLARAGRRPRRRSPGRSRRRAAARGPSRALRRGDPP